MRYADIKQQLDEVRMGERDLAAFLKTPIAQQMRAGFEAELIFPVDYDTGGIPRPDMDFDAPAVDIDRIVNFFSTEDYQGVMANDSGTVRNMLADAFRSWLLESGAENNFNSYKEEYITDWIMSTGNYSDYDEQEAIASILEDNGYDNSDINKILDIARMSDEERAKKLRANSALNADEFKENVKSYVRAKKLAREELAERVLEYLVDADINDNIDVKHAYEYFVDNYDHSDLESDWLDSEGLNFMSEVFNAFDFEWPYTTSSTPEGYSAELATGIADSLYSRLGKPVQVLDGYHSVQKDNRSWYLEPDRSITPDDSDEIGVEVVSPPMSLSECFSIMPKFFQWVDDENAYANDSTGFHMSISMPKHKAENLDFLKLALFLGDEYVLQRFARTNNEFCQSAINMIKGEIDEGDFERTLKKFKQGLDRFAESALELDYSGYGKYFSINPKNGYVEFRGAGGDGYNNDFEILQSTLLRNARALAIAMDPNAERQEYAKKLYSLIMKSRPRPTSEDVDIAALFSKYSAGEINRNQLMYHLKNRQRERARVGQERKNRELEAARRNSMVWQVTVRNRPDLPTVEVGNGNNSMPEAAQLAIKKLDLDPQDFTVNDFEIVLASPSRK